MLVKVPGGYKIRSHKTGKLYPKVYSSKEAGQNRIDQMERFSKSEFLYVILEKARVLGAKDIKKRRKKVVRDFAARMLGWDPEKGKKELIFKARTKGAKDKKKRVSQKRIQELREIERKAQTSFPFAEKLGVVK